MKHFKLCFKLIDTVCWVKNLENIPYQNMNCVLFSKGTKRMGMLGSTFIANKQFLQIRINGPLLIEVWLMLGICWRVLILTRQQSTCMCLLNGEIFQHVLKNLNLTQLKRVDYSSNSLVKVLITFNC
ncbi:CLUMA_CG012843, isoform A [Clunio marinus]|uniref:CLUMA_CG012843, isoform A n=1 Tax=Clunio marinus TaxID=568069 RepID=A0A1J1IJ08_9DIPT|nr:CLUMA_CG012843, isoform A [Clunio marinus]